LSILFDKVLDDIKTLNSLKSSEIGFARSNTLLKVFKFINDSPVGEDPLIVDTKKELNDLLEQIITIPNIFLNKIKEFEFLIKLSGDSIKKKL
jgi:hypothetical protein